MGTLDDLPIDLSFSCNPAGHPQVPDDTSVVKVPENIIRKLKAGAFGCPKARVDVSFPEPTSTLYDLMT